MWFTSDNAGPAHPSVLDAVTRASTGYMSSYGSDPIMADVRARMREIFEAPEAEIFLVATGTAANVLALACLCPPWATVYCHEVAHIEEDECGAPEFYTGGAKLSLLPGLDGKIDAAALAAKIESTPTDFVHHVGRGALSLTQVTERGAVYSLDELRALCAIAKSGGIPVHLDGARFANALVSLGCSPAEMTLKAGVDAVSFGGTKNGLMGVEAVVLFDPSKAWEFERRRKRGAHLFSKHRYLSAQMQAYLADDLWLTMARDANARARRLADGLRDLPEADFLHPVDANMLFVALPRRIHDALHAAGAHYYFWPGDPAPEGPADEMLACRLVCGWSTTEAEIDAFVGVVRDAA
ncbi:low specificity L-threonine aldolase [Halovulum dunhuangense]|uniref:L-threonine aldolase n=1 Tax=Halovulum dunhuangense TaxID=1505036 RepID=A0A849KRN8_9RHOB|nr:beta-eliminating lyase-related protein [Halovulum dunhuangense]NNU79519.1 low specificity L-threonine aldolase [Halovulum dunhuangense]